MEKCLSASRQIDSLDEMTKCVENCEAGMKEILTMQQKHAEVSRLTYAKNISRCLQIHGNVPDPQYQPQGSSVDRDDDEGE